MPVDVAPELSVVVNTLLGGRYLRRSIGALLAQREPPSMEIIVPFAPAIDNFESLAREYSTVKFVLMDSLPGGLDPADRSLAHLMYDRKRAVGMASARGRIVAVTEDQMIPDPDWCAALIRNHKLPHGAIGGAVENAGQGALHLALYLFDFGRYQRPFPAGTAVQLTDQNVSYKRAALEKVRHVWAELYDEAGIHKALMDAGESLWISPECVVRLDRGRLRLRDQLQERFTWGRVFGGKRAQRFSRLKRASMVALSPLIPVLILWSRAAAAHKKGVSPLRIAAAQPGLSAMVVWWALGESVGYLTARPFGSAKVQY